MFQFSLVFKKYAHCQQEFLQNIRVGKIFKNFPESTVEQCKSKIPKKTIQK